MLNNPPISNTDDQFLRGSSPLSIDLSSIRSRGLSLAIPISNKQLNYLQKENLSSDQKEIKSIRPRNSTVSSGINLGLGKEVTPQFNIQTPHLPNSENQQAEKKEPQDVLLEAQIHEFSKYIEEIKNVVSQKSKTENDIFYLDEKLRHLPLIKKLKEELTVLSDEEAYYWILKNLSLEEIPSGETIFKQNDSSNSKAYIILKGNAGQFSRQKKTKTNERTNSVEQLKKRNTIDLLKFDICSSNEDSSDDSPQPTPRSPKGNEYTQGQEEPMSVSSASVSSKRRRSTFKNIATSIKITASAFKFKNEVDKSDASQGQINNIKSLVKEDHTLQSQITQKKIKQPASLLSRLKLTYGEIYEELSTGQSFGERALSSKQKRRITAVALSHCELLVITYQDFERAKRLLYNKKADLTDYVLGLLPPIRHLNRLSVNQALLSCMEQKTVKIHNAITEEGKEGEYFYILCEGECDLFKSVLIESYDPFNELMEIKKQIIKPMISKEPIKLYNAQKGCILGDEILFHKDNKYSFTAKITSPEARVIAFSKQRVTRKFPKDFIQRLITKYKEKNAQIALIISQNLYLKGYDLDKQLFLEKEQIYITPNKQRLIDYTMTSPSRKRFLQELGFLKAEETPLINQKGKIIHQNQIDQKLPTTPGKFQYGNRLFSRTNSQPDFIQQQTERPYTSKQITFSDFAKELQSPRSIGATTPREFLQAYPQISFSNIDSPIGRQFRQQKIEESRSPREVQNNQQSSRQGLTQSNSELEYNKGQPLNGSQKSSFLLLKHARQKSSALINPEIGDLVMPLDNKLRNMVEQESPKAKKKVVAGSAQSFKKKSSAVRSNDQDLLQINLFDENQTKLKETILKQKKPVDCNPAKNKVGILDQVFQFHDKIDRFEEKRRQIVYFPRPKTRGEPFKMPLDGILMHQINENYYNQNEIKYPEMNSQQKSLPVGFHHHSQSQLKNKDLCKSKSRRNSATEEIVNIHMQRLKSQRKLQHPLQRTYHKNEGVLNFDTLSREESHILELSPVVRPLSTRVKTVPTSPSFRIHTQF